MMVQELSFPGLKTYSKKISTKRDLELSMSEIWNTLANSNIREHFRHNRLPLPEESGPELDKQFFPEFNINMQSINPLNNQDYEVQNNLPICELIPIVKREFEFTKIDILGDYLLLGTTEPAVYKKKMYLRDSPLDEIYRSTTAQEGFVRSLYHDCNNRIWFTTTMSLIVLTIEGNILKSFRAVKLIPFFGQIHTFVFSTDKTRGYWWSSNDEFNIIEIDTMTIMKKIKFEKLGKKIHFFVIF